MNKIGQKNSKFLEHLNEIFDRKKKLNPRFSLRAFAKHLGIDPSTLSQFLSGKRGLTDGICLKLGRKLQLSATEIFELMEDEGGASPSEQIEDWHYFAILELVNLTHFREDFSWIAGILYLDEAQVKKAVNKLVDLGALEITEDGKWINHSGHKKSLYASFKNMHTQVLQKAIHAMDKIPTHKRSQSSETLAVGLDKLALAKDKIDKFKCELTELIKSSETADEVYHLSISFYPVTDIVGSKQTGE